ncbi:MAG: helix-turn-helix transcriptional regulator [Actinomycetota bacterium]
MEKVERLVNLIALLLSTRRPLAASEIRAKLPGYSEESDEAFHRMFERDKVELRELGFVLETDQPLDADMGYRISGREALLEDPGLLPDEMAALSLAAQAWGAGADGTLGLLKLSVGAGVGEPGATGWLLPRVAVDKPVTTLLDAIEQRKVVRFAYRAVGGADEEERVVEPHRLYHRGDWYLIGFDRARGAIRHFKLSRIAGDIKESGGSQFEPPPPDARAVPHGPWEGDEIAAVVRVAFDSNAAWWVERRTGARRILDREDGWVELEMACADIHTFAGWIAGFADAAVVLEPPAVRDAVAAHLRATVEA